MRLTNEQKRKANELLYALKKIKDKNQLREAANHIIPDNQDAIPVLKGFIELLKNALDNDRIDSKECRESLRTTIAILQSMLQDGQITKDEREKTLDAILELHNIQRDLRKIEANKAVGFVAALSTIIIVIIVVANKGKA